MKTKGWKSVFTFTFIQYVKAKSFIISTIVLCILTAALTAGINIIPKMLEDDEKGISIDGTDTSTLSAVYIDDETGLLTAEDEAALAETGLTIMHSDKTREELLAELSESEKNEALILITADVSNDDVVGYRVKTYYSPILKSDAVDTATAIVKELINHRNLINAGVSEENYSATQRYIETSKIQAGSGEWNIIESALNYFIPMAVSLFLFMLIFVYGNTVAQSIAIEKTSRVMELLLTSVRPLAVVIGKVLAMGLVSICQLILIGTFASGAFIISAPFGIGGEVMEILNSPELQAIEENAQIAEAVNNTIGNFSVYSFILVFLCFVLGFLFYALLAALVGASISRMEDLQQALQPYSLAGVVGMYLAYFPVIFNVDSIETGAATINPVQIFSYYFPLSSPFALPSALLLGTLSPLQSTIAVLILAVFVVLVAMVVSKVYEGIILHNGNRIKFGDILKMAVRK